MVSPKGLLGPLLFLIYLNDLHQAIKFSKVYHFADDTNLLNISDKPSQLHFCLLCLMSLLYGESPKPTRCTWFGELGHFSLKGLFLRFPDLVLCLFFVRSQFRCCFRLEALHLVNVWRICFTSYDISAESILLVFGYPVHLP